MTRRICFEYEDNAEENLILELVILHHISLVFEVLFRLILPDEGREIECS